MKTHSSILAWRIPWTEEPGRLQSLGSKYLDITELLELGRESLIQTHTHTPPPPPNITESRSLLGTPHVGAY